MMGDSDTIVAVATPPGLVTLTAPVVMPSGIVAVILTSEFTAR